MTREWLSTQLETLTKERDDFINNANAQIEAARRFQKAAGERAAFFNGRVAQLEELLAGLKAMESDEWGVGSAEEMSDERHEHKGT